jgi:hypothetical protein
MYDHGLQIRDIGRRFYNLLTKSQAELYDFSHRHGWNIRDN